MKRLIHLLALGAVALVALTGALPATAQSSNAWTVQYFNNNGWQGAPVYTAYSSTVNFNWGSDTSPAPGVPNQNWTATLTSSAYFYAGVYEFQVTADDEYIFYIDGVQYGSTIGQGQAGKSQVFDVPLTQGTHTVQIDFRQFTGPAYLYFNWNFAKGATPPPPPPPPGPPPPAPPPPSGSLVTDFGDYTRCAQQQIHQSNCFQSNGAWNAPNLGSIQMEPQILLWEKCKPDEVKNKRLYPDKDKVSAKCSKTEAGWFPN